VCEGYEFAGNPTTYRINPARNEVVSLTDCIGCEPKTMINCSIVDENTWKCYYKDGSGIEWMHDGLLQDAFPNMKYVSVGPR